MSTQNRGLDYLVERDIVNNHNLAKRVLAEAKEKEAQSKPMPVWVDERTTKLMTLESIKRKGVEIVRVKIGKGELVWMEKKNAIKRGFITE
jgi:hypothetical protein